MAEIGSAFITVAPSMKGFRSSVDREVGAAGDSSSRTFGRRFSSNIGRAGKGAGRLLGKGLMGGALAVAGGAAIAGAFLKDALGEAREAQKVGAVTEQIIKATGGAAKVSAKQVGDLASAISAKAGVDDEAIQSGANLLLTFKNVRNETGKGAKIFDRATQAAVDLSAAGFGSIEGGSKMLGKALNDPIKGISALGRAGVTFTEQQKEQIKTLVEAGDTLGAQKIIMREVESQVGGTAAASATAGEKMSVAFGNLKEQIGTALLPVVDRLANFMTGRVIPAVSGFIKQMQTGEGAGGRFVEIAKNIGAAFGDVVGFLAPLASRLVAFFGSLSTGNSKVGEIRTTFRSVFDSVKSIVTSSADIIMRLWELFGSDIVRYLKAALSNALKIVRGVFTVIQGIFKTVSALLRGDWKGVWDGIKQILRGAVTVIIGVVRQMWNVARTIFSAGGTVLKRVASGIWGGIKTLFNRGVESLISAVRSLPGKIKALGPLLKEAGKSLLNALLNGLKGGASFVSGIAGNIWNVVKGALNSAIDRINAALEFKVAIPKAPDIHINPPNIPHLARGTDFHRGGLAMVGELGPELVSLPRGAGVLSARNTSALMSASGGLDEDSLASALHRALSAVPLTLRIGNREIGRVHLVGREVVGRLA